MQPTPQPILTLLDAQLAEHAAFDRLALAMLAWSSTPPTRPGLYGWRCGIEGPETVEVTLLGAALLWVKFPREMSMVEVLHNYPASEWAKIRRGGKHDPA
jgi:hypothetical protein